MQPLPQSRVNEWHVLIEESIGGGGSGDGSFRVTAVLPIGPDVEQARAVAADRALRHRPAAPLRPKGRWVFQLSPDSWLVDVKGARRRFHFRVSVALLTAVADS
ncbi:hypothetical protein OG417_29270 [Actinoallomurus sp. NBC_01490]|jgi:hypothetical protein|uniref:hypothetical protein n=1 Tax=Actinoallomurus sp. NBC_01490 TaxID=2903557 RepID=UPI002E2EA985|nr:hypothetical protein [Actinoallomurus sp. NBC_01490]